ncbi:MAG: hypothetical protein RE471_06785 [Ferroplasma sp.]|uniref:hypothetical protein n=1 Tax=Ferroplasma sp. TaxID=2591003 RepID=UPI002814E0E7|nr:hypothetical protein [Ferroplasma sp.]WMT50680.1 MAG: hypothetical protein RE471_06785 [Ferroplasma sp.]
MSLETNDYGIKLFSVSVILFLLLLFASYENFLLTLYGVLYLAVADVVISAISVVFMDYLDPIGYILIWFWSTFAIYLVRFLVHSSPLTAGHIFLDLLGIPIFLSLLLGGIFMVFRSISWKVHFHKPAERISESYSGLKRQYMSVEASIYYAVLIIISLFYENRGNIYFLKPGFLVIFILAAYISSLFYIVITDSAGINASVPFMFFISVLPAISFSQFVPIRGFLELILILLTVSFITFYLLDKEEIGSGGEYTGSVVSSQTDNLIGLAIIFVAWLVSSIVLNLPLNSGTVLFILLPLFVGSLMSDQIHGRRATKLYRQHSKATNFVGVIGGAGMSDGLWFEILTVIVLYLFINMI